MSDIGFAEYTEENLTKRVEDLEGQLTAIKEHLGLELGEGYYVKKKSVVLPPPNQGEIVTKGG